MRMSEYTFCSDCSLKQTETISGNSKKNFDHNSVSTLSVLFSTYDFYYECLPIWYSYGSWFRVYNTVHSVNDQFTSVLYILGPHVYPNYKFFVQKFIPTEIRSNGFFY